MINSTNSLKKCHIILAALLLACSVTLPVCASVVVDAGGSLSAQAGALRTGDQLLIQGRNEAVRFAGTDIELEDFSGMLGFTSEAAYVLVFAGEAQVGGKTVGHGRMLLLLPFGQGVAIERFDASRLRKALYDNLNGVQPLPALDRLASAQKTAIFFGRLAPTDVNINTLDSKDAEMARRERVGGQAVRQIRFATQPADGAIEQKIVSDFMRALVAGDAKAAAQFIDPLPYGYSNLGNGGGGARRLMTEALIGERDWRAFAGSQPIEAGDALWLVNGSNGNARILLRRTTEFAFVQSIEVEE